MKTTLTQLALCLVVASTLFGPRVLRGGEGLRRGEGRRGAGSAQSRTPVVQGPVLPPVLTPTGEPPAVPDRRAGAAASCADRPWPSEPFPAAGAPQQTPFGASNRALFGAQVANGQAALMVLYRYDFVPHKSALAAAGRQKLARLAVLLAESPFPLIIEPSGAGFARDAARRRHVIQQLASLPFPVPAERVIVAPPPSRGMRGVEAHSLYFKFMETMGGGGETANAPASALLYPPN